MTNYFLDFSTFSDAQAAQDLYSNSIRKGLGYDSYGNKTKFTAVVLSNPIPIRPADLKYFNAGTQEPTSKVSKFVYRGRIVDENSPHQFLPDPCDTTYASDPDTALKIVAMHTLFVSDSEMGVGESLPRLGSTVKVELTKNFFGYNISYGRHIKVMDSPGESSGDLAKECDKISEIMANAEGAPLSSYDDGENRGGPPLDDPQVEEIYNKYLELSGGQFAPAEGMCGGLPGYSLEKCKTGTIGGVSVTLHPKFFNKVKEKYDLVNAQNFGEPFKGGSSLRSVKTQISLRIGNAKSPLSIDQYIKGRSKLCKPPTAPLPVKKGGGSRHIYGCAIDFGGILISGGAEAAELKNSIARDSKTYNFLLKQQEDGFKNYSAEPWHWSVDGK